MSTLIALSGELAGQRLEVSQELVIGRSDECDVTLEDRRLSRRHARFYLEDGRLFVEDLGSPNGTLVNQRRVRIAKLEDGDLVTLCASIFRVAGPLPPEVGLSLPLEPAIVRPAEQRSPKLEQLAAEDYYTAIGIGEATVLDATKSQREVLLQKTRHFAVLHELSRVMEDEVDELALLERVLDLLLKVVGADRAYVALGTDQAQLTLRCSRHRKGRQATVRISKTMARYVVEQRNGVVLEDRSMDERFSESASMNLASTRALVAAPLLHAGNVLGLIALESGQLGASYDEETLELTTVVGASVAAALARLRATAQREETIVQLEKAQEQLRSAQDQLVRSQQLAAVGRLAAGIAHEVKNHLSPFTLVEMIARRYPDDKDFRESAEMMTEAQRHILDLVNEVRTFASGASREYDKQREDLVGVVQSILRFVNLDPDVRPHELVFTEDAEPIVELDQARFRQVLVNLIRNAAQAMGAERGKIVVRVHERGELAMVDIIDSGPGMSDDVAAKVFEPFFSTKGDRGLGLGLDISRQIIRDHGGELGFESKEGQGTTFRLALPKA